MKVCNRIQNARWCTLLPGLALVMSVAVFGEAGAASRVAPAALLQQMGLNSATVQTLDLPNGTVKRAFSVQLDLAGAVFELQLQPWSLRSSDFQLLERGAGGAISAVTPPAPTTYRGELSGSTGSRVAASLGDDGLWAWIETPQQNWLVQPAGSSQTAGTHVIYRPEDTSPLDGTCVPALPPPAQTNPWTQTPDAQILPPAKAEPTATELILAATGIMTLEMAVDTDRLLYEFHGSSASAVLADVETIMNAVNLIYEAQFQTAHMLTAVVMRTTVGDDLGWSTAEYRLEALRDDWGLNHSGIRRDLVHHFCEDDLFGTTVGVAYLNVICNRPDGAYGLSQTHFDTDFARRVALTAHEIGHNWGAEHCNDDSDCQIMCTAIGACEPTISSFGSSAVATITAHRDSTSCRVPAYPSVVYVDDTVPFPGHGTFSDPFATVGLGAQNSLDGGLLLVRPGQYTETPLLQRQLLIKAAGGNAVIGY